MKRRVHLFGAFSKVTKRDDGTLDVEGIASSETRDSEKELVKGDAMRGAIPNYMEWANVREMHQAIAAGTAVELTVDDQNVTHIKAHIVDEGSIKKVETGVLKGFSIAGTIPTGGRNKVDPTIIERIELSEISLVDRPANPDARITQISKMQKGAADTVAKGLWTVGAFATVVQDLQYLQENTAWEAEYEGDDSPIPARIKAAVKDLCGILCDLVAEETAELVGDAPEAEAVAMAAKPGALTKSEKFGGALAAFAEIVKSGAIEKKGAKFSAASKAALADIHKCVKDAHEKLGALGYDKADPDDPESQKAFAAEVQKVSAERDEIKKSLDAANERADIAEKVCAEAGEVMKAQIAREADLSKQLADAKLEVAKKGSLRAVPVEKSKDGHVAKAATATDEKTGADVVSNTLDVIKSAQKTAFQPAVGGLGVR